MKNIFIFIRIYFNFISFVTLQICCVLILNKYSKTHEVFFAGVANEMVGKVNKKYDNVHSYLNLQVINKQLAEENAHLRDSLISSRIKIYSGIDSTSTTKADTSTPQRKYEYYFSRVVGNNVSSQTNILTLERGRLQGIYKGMGVIGPQGIVGEVIEVSDNYCRVMSLLHRKTSVSAMLKRDKNFGTIEWDGVNPSYVILRNIPKSAKIFKGDSVVTSNYSSIYPPNIMIGTVESIRKDNSSNFFILKLKTTTNFFNLEYVYAVKNTRYNEQHSLEEIKLKQND